MSYVLSWMGDVLRSAGMTVVETPGWQMRGHDQFGPAKGVLLHHTAGPHTGDMPSLKTLIQGRPDLAGPLCNLGLSREGTWYCVAAGKAYHAGAGQWHDVKPTYWGNSQMIGIEGENCGTVDDPWPAVQMDALRRGVAALLTHIRAPAMMVAGHREYATPAGRKIDPLFDMHEFRESIAALVQPALAV